METHFEQLTDDAWGALGISGGAELVIAQNWIDAAEVAAESSTHAPAESPTPTAATRAAPVHTNDGGPTTGGCREESRLSCQWPQHIYRR